MKNRLIAIALFLMAFGGTSVFAQTPAKIGYVDSRAVSDKLPEVKQAYSVLNEFSRAKENELRKEAEQFQQRVQQFENEAQSMDAKLASAKEKELMAQQEQLQVKQSAMQTEVQKKQQQLFDPIEKRIQNAITQVANENGYQWVLAKEVLLHYPTGDDLSDLVVKKLLENAPKDQPAASTNQQAKPAAGSSSTNTSNAAPKKK